MGDDVQDFDFDRADDAVAQYVASMTRTTPADCAGTVFAYNNSGLVVAGQIIEVLTGSTYESAVQRLLLDQLQRGHTHYFSDQIVGLNVAAEHDVVDANRLSITTFGPLRLAATRPARRFQRARSTALHQVSPRRRHRTRWNAAAGRAIAGGDTLGPRRGRHPAGRAHRNGCWLDAAAVRRRPGHRPARRHVELPTLPATPQHLSAGELAPYQRRYVAELINESGRTTDAFPTSGSAVGPRQRDLRRVAATQAKVASVAAG